MTTWPWLLLEPSPAVVDRVVLVDQVHAVISVELLADGSTRLRSGGDPYEYTTLRPGELAEVGRKLLELADRATEHANAPVAKPPSSDEP